MISSLFLARKNVRGDGRKVLQHPARIEPSLPGLDTPVAAITRPLQLSQEDLDAE